jgi:hypothetical protein
MIPFVVLTVMVGGVSLALFLNRGRGRIGTDDGQRLNQLRIAFAQAQAADN